MNYIFWLTPYVAYMFLWRYISIFCHENGHLIAAKLVGFVPNEIRVGRGFNISVKWFFQSKLVIGVIPSGGVTSWNSNITWKKLKFFRIKQAFAILGGPLASLILFLVNLIIIALTDSDILIYIAFFELIFLLCNLIPSTTNIHGETVQSDGMNFINAITNNYEKVFKDTFVNYQKSIFRYSNNLPEDYLFLNNDLSKLSILIEAEGSIKDKNFCHAIILIEDLLKCECLTNLESAYLLDILSSIVINHRQKQYLPQADNWSKKALNIAGFSKTIQGTRGAILVELGNYIDAKQILMPLTESENEILDIAICSCYIAKAEYHLGNSAKQLSWMKYAENVCGGDKITSKVIASIKQELKV